MRAIPRTDATQRGRCALPPKAQFYFVVALNDFVAIAKAGTYTFTAHLRATFAPDVVHTLTSNPSMVIVPDRNAWSDATPSPTPVITLGGPDDALSHKWITVGRVERGIRLSLTPQKLTARVGEPLNVSLWAKSGSESYIFTCIGFFYQRLRFSVVDSEGMPVATHLPPREIDIGVRDRCGLNPQDQYRFPVPLSDFVTIKTPGTYKVTAVLQASFPIATIHTITSNPITLQVIP